MSLKMETRVSVAVKPSPLDFDVFLPWACGSLGVEYDIVITRTVMDKIEHQLSKSARSKSRTEKLEKHPITKPPSTSFTDALSEDSISEPFTKDLMREQVVMVETVYDPYGNLVHVKFLKNKFIPRVVIKIIGLIKTFHPLLTTITVNDGLRMQAIYEISQLLPNSQITELFLDGTFLREANYHVLLGQSPLKLLSLSKCKINDDVVHTIANKITFPNSASKTLSILNLASNRITDIGAEYIAAALRFNRQLSYLNLSDNMLSDCGAKSIFECLGEFPATEKEYTDSRLRYMKYLKAKAKIIDKAMKENQFSDIDKKMRRKSMKPNVVPLKKSKDDVSLPISRSLQSVNLSVLNRERAEAIAFKVLGPFVDPFGPKDTSFRDGISYCYGNNTLCYLNLAYNNLSYSSVKKLCEILLTQKLLNRKPRGLINVVLDGNYLPKYCEEYKQIEKLLNFEMGNGRSGKQSVFSKKKGFFTPTSSAK